MTRHILIGDIHGCFAELERLLAMLDVTDADRVISLGDLVDRGPDSARVWELFRDRPNFAAIMGNHERKHVRGVLSFSQEIVRLQMGERYEAFRAWAAELPYFLETDAYVAVHGGFEDGVPLAQQREDVLAATTSGTKHLERLYDGAYWPDVYSGEQPVVFGHHVVGDEAKVLGERCWALDTGACFGGWLTALAVPGFTLHRVKADRDHWKAERKRWRLPVLKAKPWASYRFGKLERELGALRKYRAESVKGFVVELEAWLAGVDALVVPLIERLHARRRDLVATLPEGSLKKGIARDPDAHLIFTSLSGSLDRAALVAHLSSPEAILAAAQRHGLELAT